MTVVRVNPQSVQTYGRDAQAKFDGMRNELVQLVNSVVEVRYFGPNAVDFKTRAGQLAADFANSLNRDIAMVASAVEASTSAIASSLGGARLSLPVNGTPITAPVPASVDYVDVDTAALDALTSEVNRHFQGIESLLDSHLSSLRGTDWAGNAKEQAVASVVSFTSSARAKCQEAQQAINSYITSQVQSVVAADR